MRVKPSDWWSSVREREYQLCSSTDLPLTESTLNKNRRSAPHFSNTLSPSTLGSYEIQALRLKGSDSESVYDDPDSKTSFCCKSAFIKCSDSTTYCLLFWAVSTAPIMPSHAISMNSF
ncbi:hypothetical protein ACFX19_027899 [Malus domestica]